MGERLLRYYKYIGDKLGLDGKIKLAIETKLPSTKAAMVADDQENISKFRSAISKLTDEEAPHY